MLALTAYTYKGWTVMVPITGDCIIIGTILARFATRAKALAWIDARRHD